MPGLEDFDRLKQQLLMRYGMGGGEGSSPALPGLPGGDFRFGENQIAMSPWGRTALSAATMLPFPFGTLASAAQIGIRTNNLINTNRIRGTLGLPDTNFGQALGGLFGLNDYASANANARIGSLDFGAGETVISRGGIYDNGGWFDTDIRTAFTPEEARRRRDVRRLTDVGEVFGRSRNTAADRARRGLAAAAQRGFAGADAGGSRRGQGGSSSSSKSSSRGKRGE